jgi:hypothetical protein
MTTSAINSMGTTVSFNGNTIGEIESYSGGGVAVNIHEILTCDSTDFYADKLAGALNSGNVTFGMIYQSAETSGNYDKLKTDAEARTSGTLLVTFPNGATITGSAIIANLGDPNFGSADEPIKFSCEFARKGKFTHTGV